MSRRFYVPEDVRFLIQKYDTERYRIIRDRIIKQKKYPTITVWNNIIADGIEEFELCEKNSLPYRINVVSFSSIYHLYSWICSKQIVRDDLNKTMYRFLIGFQVLAEKAIEGSSPLGNKGKMTVIERMAKLYGYNTQRISYYKQFASNMVKIHDTNPALAEYILSERVVASWNNVEFLSKKGSSELEDLLKLVRSREDEGQLIFNDIQKSIDENYRPKRMKKRIESGSGPEIKKMPEYDPDSELKSLSLTISSWINTIDRADDKSYVESSRKAKAELSQALRQLANHANSMRKHLGAK